MSLNTQLGRSLKAPARPVWEEPPSKAGLTAKTGFLELCCLGVLGPLWIVIVTSLSPKPVIDRVGGLVVIPQGITFVNYTELLSGGQVSRAIMVSVGVTLVGTLFSMTVSVLAAYGLSRPGSLGHRFFLMTMMATMFFGAGLIPTYLLVQSLGLTDTYLSLILSSAVSVFNILVLRVAAGNVHTATNTGRSHTVGLRSDGTVLATGWNGDGQCDVAGWRGVTAVAAGWRRTLGLLADGRVLAVGRSSEGQCDVQSWREMVVLSCGDWHSVGVRADGSALAAGNNRRGQCAVDGWRDLASISAGYLHTVGLRVDGRAVATGERATRACAVGEWENVVALDAGSYHTVGVTASGRVLAVGDNSYGQCEVGDWRDVVAVAAGSTHTLGLRANGTVVTAENNADGQCEVDAWSGVQLP